MIALLFSKIKYYAIAAFAAVVSVGVVLAKVRADGAKLERLKNVQDKLTDKKVEADVDASIASYDAAARRDRLLKRWARR